MTAVEIKNTDRTTKINFITKSLTLRNGKKITKKSLQNYSDDTLNHICEKFNDDFQDFINNPPAKLHKFYVLTEKALYEYSAEDETHCIQYVKNDKLKFQKIVPAKGHHICKYCNHIADGSDKDILCEKCRKTFGHTLYSEL